jgi:hypothetical protein
VFRRRVHVRLHLVDDLGSIEGLLVTSWWRFPEHYKLLDASFLESRSDRHPLDNAGTYVPRQNVRFFEELKPAPTKNVPFFEGVKQ